jgi:hypothetical protein
MYYFPLLTLRYSLENNSIASEFSILESLLLAFRTFRACSLVFLGPVIGPDAGPCLMAPTISI